MMLVFKKGILLLGIVFFLCSCGSNKKLSYFQDLTDTGRSEYVKVYPYKPLKLQIDDQLQISISSTSTEAAQFFNIVPVAGGANNNSTAFSYVVANNGNITLPVIGEIQVVGATSEEVKTIVQRLLIPYLKDAVVTVRLTNFKVTVIGEIGHAVTLPVNGEHVNALEAIGAAGDMTNYGQRYNVTVIRKVNDSLTSVGHLNFTTSNVFKSPYFQLHQNDVVYVEPSKLKGFLSGNTVILLPIITSVISLIIVLYGYLR